MSTDPTSTSETSDYRLDSGRTTMYLTDMNHYQYSVYQRKGQGNYLVQFINPETGKKTNRSTGTTNRKDAYKAAEEIVRLSFNPHVDVDVHTVQDLLAEYSKYQRDIRKAKEASVSRTHRVLNDLANDLNAQSVNDLCNSTGINAFISKQLETKARGTVKQITTHIVAFYHWLQRFDFIDQDVVKKINRLRLTDADRAYERGTYTQDELDNLYAAAEGDETISGWTPEARAMAYRIGAMTGLRRNEICALTRSDFVLDAEMPFLMCRASTAKNQKTNRQYMPNALVAALRTYLSNLTGHELFPATRETLSVLLNHDQELAGMPKYDQLGRKRDLHALRTTYVSNLIERGADIKTVQTLARHANPVLTLKAYAKVDDVRLSDAANLLNGDSDERS